MTGLVELAPLSSSLSLTAGGHSSNLGFWHVVNLPECPTLHPYPSARYLSPSASNVLLIAGPQPRLYPPVTFLTRAFHICWRHIAMIQGEVNEELQKAVNGTQRAVDGQIPPSLPP